MFKSSDHSVARRDRPRPGPPLPSLVRTRDPFRSPSGRPFPGGQTSAGSSAGRLSMKELTENTARPGPGSPYPGGEASPKSSIVAR